MKIKILNNFTTPPPIHNKNKQTNQNILTYLLKQNILIIFYLLIKIFMKYIKKTTNSINRSYFQLVLINQ